jgi:hypothetical protein
MAKRKPEGPTVDRITVLKWLAQQNRVNRDLETILVDMTRQTLQYRRMLHRLKWTVRPRRFKLARKGV